MLCFLIFWALFPKIIIFEVEKFYPTKYEISNQLILFSGNFVCKTHAFNGADPCQIMQNFWIMSLLYETLASGRYHTDMKALKILASSSKNLEFMVLLTNNKLMSLGCHFKYYFFFDNFCFKHPLVLETHRGMFFDLEKL